MKTNVKRLIRDQRGGAYVLVLVLLIVGGLIIAPVLGHMGTGIIAGGVHEKRMDELYAADAGVEDAIWKIKNDPPSSYPYPYPDALSINGKSVQVEIDRELISTGCPKVYRYYIRSTATGSDDSQTAVESYVRVQYDAMNFGGLLDYALSSNHTIQIEPDTYIDGDVYLPAAEDLIDNGHILGEIHDYSNVVLHWPTFEQLSAYYLNDVEGAPDPGPSVDIKDYKTIGPLYREGGLTIYNSGGPDTLKLENTIYIKGTDLLEGGFSLLFESPGKVRPYIIDLNGQTIFVEGSIWVKPQFISFVGSGCIIATGNILFEPDVSNTEGDYILLLSLGGTTTLKPSKLSEGVFYGSVAGDAHVQLEPGNTLEWTEWRDKNLNFPMGDYDGDDDSLLVLGAIIVESWQIK